MTDRWPRFPLFLLEGDRISGYASTGSLGEFRLETEPRSDLRLRMLIDFDRCIDVRLNLDSAVEAPAQA